MSSNYYHPDSVFTQENPPNRSNLVKISDYKFNKPEDLPSAANDSDDEPPPKIMLFSFVGIGAALLVIALFLVYPMLVQIEGAGMSDIELAQNIHFCATFGCITGFSSLAFQCANYFTSLGFSSFVVLFGMGF